jgi:hypothetical protein
MSVLPFFCMEKRHNEIAFREIEIFNIQGGSNMIGTICV